MRKRFHRIALAFVFLICSLPAQGMDYLRLRNGQVVEGAILRQDSSAVIMTRWEDRNSPLPPLTAYGRDEVESIWFVDPRSDSARHAWYSPHAGSLEIGGSVLFQTWAETELVRRDLFQIAFQGGYAITRAIAVDASSEFTIPFGGGADSVWRQYGAAYQFSMSVVGQPFRWKSMIPYALAGGGAAIGTPVNGLILTHSKQVRSLVNAGLGVKWGFDHVGIRAEWRHHFYTWTPDAVDERGIRVPEHTADASVVRVGVFYFR